MVLHGRTRERNPVIRLEPARSLGLPCLGILNVLGFVEEDSGPGDQTQVCIVPIEQVITCEDHIKPCHLAGKGFAMPASCAMMHVAAKSRREPLRFAHPVPEHGHGACYQRGLLLATLFFVHQEGERLDRLAQAHVIGQAAPETA